MTPTRSVQYTAACPACRGTRSLTREQVMTGRNPVCDHDGAAMVVYSATNGRPNELPVDGGKSKAKR
jgi:hypothetical protein